MFLSQQLLKNKFLGIDTKSLVIAQGSCPDGGWGRDVPRRGKPLYSNRQDRTKGLHAHVIVYWILYTLYMEYCVLYLLAVFQAVLIVYSSQWPCFWPYFRPCYCILCTVLTVPFQDWTKLIFKIESCFITFQSWNSIFSLGISIPRDWFNQSSRSYDIALPGLVFFKIRASGQGADVHRHQFEPQRLRPHPARRPSRIELRVGG